MESILARPKAKTNLGINHVNTKSCALEPRKMEFAADVSPGCWFKYSHRYPSRPFGAAVPPTF